MNRTLILFGDLENASVLITGGASGIGAELTKGFVAQGAKVAFIDIAEQAAKNLCKDIAGQGLHEPLFLHADLTDTAVTKQAVETAATAHGPITVLVNNAALDSRHSIEEITGEYWDRNQAINLKAQFFTIQAVVPGMIAAGGGNIVNFTSTSYMLNIGEMPSYTAAKAGVVGLTKGLAGKLGPNNIRVNAIAPGWVMTERQKELWVTLEALEANIGRQCLKRQIEPEDMVGPCLFLASRASGMITAQVLIADGGML